MSGFYATIARYYDAENTDKTDDLVMYSELAEEYGGPILDIGCGTGRVLFHLTQEGYTVHGIESEFAMLERAKIKLDMFPQSRDKLMLFHGDVLTYEFSERYKLVLLSYNSLMHFHTLDEQVKLLKRLRDLLEDDGLLVIDLPNAGEVFATQDTNGLSLERTFIDPDSGHMVMQQAVSVLDRAQQLIEVTWVYDEINEDGLVQRTVAPVIFRHFFLAEITLLLQQTGFVMDAVYGDADLMPFENGCERMIVFAQPA